MSLFARDELKMTTGIFRRLGSDLNSASTASPLFLGKLRSRITRSGHTVPLYLPSCRRKASASAPSLTLETWQEFEFNVRASLAKKTSATLSSTSSTSEIAFIGHSLFLHQHCWHSLPHSSISGPDRKPTRQGTPKTLLSMQCD